MTLTDIKLRVSAGRAMMEYVAAKGRFDLFAGVNLNLNFPSVIGTVEVGDREIEYGYSSGIYTKYVSKSTPIRSVPSQEEIDSTGWRQRPCRLGSPLRVGCRTVPRQKRDAGGRRLPDRS